MQGAGLTRKDFLKAAVLSAAGAALPMGALAAATAPKGPQITLSDLKSFCKLAGLSFTDAELKEALPDIKGWLDGYHTIRTANIRVESEPPTTFRPRDPRVMGPQGIFTANVAEVQPTLPNSDVDIAYLSVNELGHLIRNKQLSPVRLTEIYLRRLEQYGDKLLCVITLLKDRAMQKAREAEAEINAGRYRGPLHGIPCGIKDLFALKGAPTTWGAGPYKDQHFDYDSTVVERLDAAGAIILAKLSMGALAQNDVWFKGKTKNPWNPKEGSSGSSAGSACATAAGLVAFGIGTETLGSICSPSNRCRVTGLRPTYGRISRAGAMGLSYTMDKVGPICREVEDCALVLAALMGPDGNDRTVLTHPFQYRNEAPFKTWKVGVIEAELKRSPAIGKTLESLGISFVPVKITPAADALIAILEVEAAAAFDDFTRSGKVRGLKDSAWNESFRASRFVPGVEYLRAQTARAELMEQFDRELGDLDAVITTGIGNNTIVATNFTGHPQVIIPNGVTSKGQPLSISFVGRLYEEEKILRLAKAYQDVGDFHKRRPKESAWG